MDDWELLQAYALQHDETAFTELVNRHISLVYSAALRELGERHDAQEVTQAVFIILARKAAELGRARALAPWLMRTTHYTAANARRSLQRRQHLDSLAARAGPRPESEAAWARIASSLDDALMTLRSSDREAVVLRYFENKSYKAIAASLGVSDDTVQKRVSRAVEKLRDYFAKTGEILPAAVLVAAISGFGVQKAPADLASAVTAAVFKGAPLGGIAPLVESTLTAFRWTSLRRVAIWCGLAAFTISGGILTTTSYLKPRNGAGKTGPAAAPAPNALVQGIEPAQIASLQPVALPAPAAQAPPSVVAAGTAPGPVVGSGSIQLSNAEVQIALDIYKAMLNVELVISPEVQRAHVGMRVTIQPERDPLTADDGAKLIEQELRKQCGLTLTPLGGNRVLVGRVAPDQMPVTETEAVPVVIRALDAGTEEPLSTFKVYVNERPGVSLRYLGEGKNGMFNSTNRFATKAKYTIELRAEGYLPAITTAANITNQAPEAELRLTKAADFIGRVLSPEGKPIEGASVFLAGKGFGPRWVTNPSHPEGFPVGSDRDPDKQTSTDAQGEFVLRPAPDAEYIVIIHDSGSAAVGIRTLTEHPVKLEGWGQIEGYLQITSGSVGSQNISVALQATSEPHVPYRVTGITDKSGRFTLSKVPPGRHRVSRMVNVEGPSGVRAPTHTIDILVAAGQTAEVILDDATATGPVP